MRSFFIVVIIQTFSLDAKAQLVYLRPLLANKIDNYSANPHFSEDKFEEDGISYKISSPRYKVNATVEPGIMIGIKTNLFFAETGICREHVTSDSKVEISSGNMYKAYRYTSGLNVSRIPIQLGFMAYTFKDKPTKPSLKHEFWITMGVAFTHSFKQTSIYKREDKFALGTDEFIINNTYGFATFGYFKNFTAGLEYQLYNVKRRNLLSINLSYSLVGNTSVGLMTSYIDISHSSTSGNKKNYY